MTDTEINIPLLVKTLDWATDQWRRRLRGEPSEWNQATWMTAWQTREGHCGTACCIAGRVALEEGWLPLLNFDVVVAPDGATGHPSSIAREALGLTREEADELFNACNGIGDLWALAHRLTDGAVPLPADHVDMPRWRA